MDVDIVFNCYEKTFNRVLDEEFISYICKRNSFPFKNRIVIINNVNDRNSVTQIAQALVEKEVIQAYYFVEDWLEESFKPFNLSNKYFGRIYKMSNWDFTMIKMVQSPYLLHWDEYADIDKEIDWITPSLALLESNPQYFCATPIMKGRKKELETNIIKDNNEFLLDYEFSDHIFLIKTEYLRKQVFRSHHFWIYTYPMAFIAPMWEARVDAYMRTHDLVRINFKGTTYDHLYEGAGRPKFSFWETRRRNISFRLIFLYKIFYDPIHNHYYSLREILSHSKSNWVNIKNMFRRIK